MCIGMVIIGVLVGRWACIGSVELCMCVSVCMRVGYVLRVHAKVCSYVFLCVLVLGLGNKTINYCIVIDF